MYPNGGSGGSRTRNLLLAGQALSQLELRTQMEDDGMYTPRVLAAPSSPYHHTHALSINVFYLFAFISRSSQRRGYLSLCFRLMGRVRCPYSPRVHRDWQ